MNVCTDECIPSLMVVIFLSDKPDELPIIKPDPEEEISASAVKVSAVGVIKLGL